MYSVWGMLLEQHPSHRTHYCNCSLTLLKKGRWLPETCWADSKINKIVTVASSWSFTYIIHLHWWCTVKHKSKVKKYVEIKCQLDATEVFIADLIACSTCFGHHYAHHQELKSIQWLLPPGISCCKNVKDNFVSFCGICVLSLKCRVLSRFVARCVECRVGCVWVF